MTKKLTEKLTKNDFVIFSPPEKMFFGWISSHIQKTENLFLTKISWDLTVKNGDLAHPNGRIYKKFLDLTA